MNSLKALDVTRGIESKWYIKRPSLIRQDAQFIDVTRVFLEIKPDPWTDVNNLKPKSKEYVKGYGDTGISCCRYSSTKDAWFDKEGNEIKVSLWKKY